MQTETKARFVTDELVNKSFLRRSVDERVIERELVLLDELRSPILEAIEQIRCVCERISELDLNSSLAVMAQKYNYTRPRILDHKQQPVLKIIDGRHPILDRKFFDAQPAQHFTPNSLELTEQSKQGAYGHFNFNFLGRFVLLTGPNMGGKSTFLRQNALICLMAQCGSFVPARECELSPVDAIFTRIGASDDLCRDQSTFMLEMSETAHILRACTERSLLIIDEIGRGTSPQEGSSLASAIAQHLSSSSSSQPRTLFATHYHSIAEHLPPAPTVQRLCTEADFDEEGGKIILIPSLRPGVQKHSFALPVALLAGIPESIISRAKSLLHE